MPVRRIIRRLGALSRANDAAVLEGDLVVLQELEGVRAGASTADQLATNHIGVAVKVNGHSRISKFIGRHGNTITITTFQQSNGIAVFRRIESRRQGFILRIADLGDFLSFRHCCRNQREHHRQ